MRQRWFGATHLKVPEIAIEGEDVELLDESHVRLSGETYEVLILDDLSESKRLRDAHEAGTPVIVRATTAEEIKKALARPEVACVAVPPSARELQELDLTKLTYG